MATASRARRNSDHVVLMPDGFRCLRCLGKLQLVMPVAIGDYVAASKSFVGTHAKCKQPKGEQCAFCLARGHSHMTCPAVTTPHEWRSCPDTGMSSEAIFKAAMMNSSDGSYPFDPGDFGRCHRLLQRFPELLSPAFEVLARASGVWRRYADAWADMTALYVEELPSGNAPKLYALMQRLEKGGGGGTTR